MLKGIPQARRNNAWHKKHTKNMAHVRMSHASRVLLRNRIKLEQGAKKATEFNKKVGFFARLKFFWLMAKVKTRARMRKMGMLFNNPTPSEA